MGGSDKARKALNRIIIRKEMAMSYIEKDLNLVHEMDIESDLGKEEKIDYLETQIAETKKIIWRFRVDVVLLVCSEAESEEVKERQEQKAKETKREIRQLVAGLKVLEQLVEEVKNL
jgi:hypothetical protein